MFKRMKQWLTRSAKKQPTYGYYYSGGIDDPCPTGYVKLSNNPDVQSAVMSIAQLVSSMTIHLMQESEYGGHERVKNGLSRKIDIDPHTYMTRKEWVEWVVKTALVDGKGNAVVIPEYSDDGRLLENLTPVQPSLVSFDTAKVGQYTISVSGVPFDPSELLHFKYNVTGDSPFIGRGINVYLQDVLKNIDGADKTKQRFFSGEYKPSVIVAVDANTKSFRKSEQEGRDPKDAIYEEYLKTSPHRPFIVPADMFEFQELRPLSLKDLAVNEGVEIDKRTIAAILGVPAFLLGIGEYDREEYNAFITRTIMPIAKSIEQELTKKLLIDDGLHFRFNSRSLYSYSLKETVDAGVELIKTNAASRNEIRDWIGMSPREDMEELIVLENYIAQDDIGKQGKLKE